MMRSIFMLILLCNGAVGQEQVEFKGETQALISSLKKLGTGELPGAFDEAEDLATIKRLRVEAAKEQVEALQARFRAGIDNINFLLRAQIELTIAELDTTDVKEKQLDYIREGLESSILVWQRVMELQKVGARGGDTVAAAQSRQQVLKYYVWWQKCNAGLELGPTLADPGNLPR